MKRLLLFKPLLIILLFACNNIKNDKSESLTHLPLNERLERIFSENKEEKFNFTINYPKELKLLYKSNNFSSYWVKDDSLTQTAQDLLSFFDSTMIYGLPGHFYPINHLKNSKDPLEIEIALSESLFRVIKHLGYGILDSASTNINWDLQNHGRDLTEFIQKNHNDSLFIDHILAFQPNDFQYIWLINAWRKYLAYTNLDNTKFDVPTIKEDSAKAYQTARKVLIYKNYIDSLNNSKDSALMAALESYQKDHMLKPDHIIGSNTASALEKSEWNKFQQVVLAIEKMKWKRDLKGKYLRVNIGEQKLRLIDSNRVVREHRIIVGHINTQTPELKSKLKRMVLYPYWNVPHSISSKELVYGARRDTAYMRKHGYKVFRGKTEVDASKINWKNYNKDKFPFRIRQEPGPKNSLGIVKFLFPNKHSVYLHDTPNKWLFRTKMRYYSHGCMRLEKPQELAYYLIATDPKNNFIADSLEVELAKAERQSISLRKPIPLFIEYITVGADSIGNIQFYLDQYGRDKKFIKALFQK